MSVLQNLMTVFIDKLPTGPEWTCEVFELQGDLLDEQGNPRTEEVELWKRDPVA